jgi:hypothetical protein
VELILFSTLGKENFTSQISLGEATVKVSYAFRVTFSSDLLPFGVCVQGFLLRYEMPESGLWSGSVVCS